MFAVEDIDDTVARLRAHGAELVGEVAQSEDKYRLCYMRGPAGIIVGSGSAELRRREPHETKLKSNHSAFESLTAATRQESDEFRKTKVAATLPERRWDGPTRISLSNVP